MDKRKVGRPRIFSTPEQMMDKALEYQKVCLEYDRPFLVIGFASWMGIHKTSLYEYNKYPEFSESMGKISQLAEVGLIEGGLTGKYNSSFAQFIAKNNHDYRDKQEVEHSGEAITGIKVEFVGIEDADTKSLQ